MLFNLEQLKYNQNLFAPNMQAKSQQSVGGIFLSEVTD